MSSLCSDLSVRVFLRELQLKKQRASQHDCCVRMTDEKGLWPYKSKTYKKNCCCWKKEVHVLAFYSVIFSYLFFVFLLGCLDPGDYPSSSNCNACRYARHNGACARQCPAGHSATGENKNCVGKLKWKLLLICTKQASVCVSICTEYAPCLIQRLEILNIATCYHNNSILEWNSSNITGLQTAYV